MNYVSLMRLKKMIAISLNLHPKDLEWLQTFQGPSGDNQKEKATEWCQWWRLKKNPEEFLPANQSHLKKEKKRITYTWREKWYQSWSFWIMLKKLKMMIDLIPKEVLVNIEKPLTTLKWTTPHLQTFKFQRLWKKYWPHWPKPEDLPSWIFGIRAAKPPM
jgi:hypothetical protein